MLSRKSRKVVQQVALSAIDPKQRNRSLTIKHNSLTLKFEGAQLQITNLRLGNQKQTVNEEIEHD